MRDNDYQRRLDLAIKYETVETEWDYDALKRVCEAHETHFGDMYGMEHVPVQQRAPHDHYLFLDRGADILAVAHLDTVASHEERMCTFADTPAGPVVHSGALDDRLGAYIILELLPRLGIKVDVLLTVGEESGQSTAQFFDPPKDKEYLWGIEFDRGGTDVVMYDYEDKPTEALVRACGARVGQGSFSDIAYLEHLEVKCFNWGVGYQDYHGPRGYAYLEDTWAMVAYFMRFHDANHEEYLPHEQVSKPWYRSWGSGAWAPDSDYTDWWEKREARWRAGLDEDEHYEDEDGNTDCPLYTYDKVPVDCGQCSACGADVVEHVPEVVDAELVEDGRLLAVEDEEPSKALVKVAPEEARVT